MVENFSEIIIENLPDALYAINMNGEVVIWNKQVENLTGVKKENIIGKGNYEYSMAFYRERIPGLVDTLLDKTGQLEKSFINFKRDGNTVVGERQIKDSNKTLVAWASLLFDKDGNQIIGEVVTIKDITQAREHEDNFIKIFEASPEPIAIVDYESLNIIRANKVFDNFIGNILEHKEVNILNLIENNDNIIKNLNAKGKIEQMDIKIKKNGDYVYGILSTSFVTINEKKCIIMIIRDITKQKNLEIYLKTVKSDSEKKINEYVVEQNTRFKDIMLKYEKEIKETLQVSQNIIKTLTLNETEKK